MRLKKKERHEMPDRNEMPEEIPEKPLPDGFGKGFAAGVLATLFTGAMFFAEPENTRSFADFCESI